MITYLWVAMAIEFIGLIVNALHLSFSKFPRQVEYSAPMQTLSLLIHCALGVWTAYLLFWVL